MAMNTRDRWISMAAVVVAGLLMTFDIACQQGEVEQEGEGKAVSTAACPADAKPANLSLTLKDMNGADVTLSSHKGKVLLINFWATWCAPCKAEIPGFVELQKQYEKDLQIFGVSGPDEDEGAVVAMPDSTLMPE